VVSSFLLRCVLRWAYRLLYNQLAWTYDAVAWTVSLGQWREWGRTVLPHLRGPRVLDLAHGPGHLSAEMKARGYRVVGYDLSPSMGCLARRNLARHGVTVPLARGLAQGLPFPAGTFNSIVATFPADFILHPVTWREVRRVLAADGIFLVVPTAVYTGGGPIARLQASLSAPVGESPSPVDGLLARLAGSDFDIQVEWVSLPRSRVMLIRNFPIVAQPSPSSVAGD
jgi:SAM-dependent methyltransferase